MFEISRRAQLALYVLVELARAPDRRRSAEDLAKQFVVSNSHLAKVLQDLGRQYWIEGTRGAGGGYKLMVDPKKISMADVIELLEGKTNLSRCSLAHESSACGGNIECEIGHVMNEINEHAYYTLKSINLQLLAKPRRKGSTAAILGRLASVS